MAMIDDPSFRMKYGSQLPGGEEVVPWVWFDTQTYTSASTVSIEFFTATNSDKTKSNMELGGQLAAPKYFVLRSLKIIPKIQPVSDRLTAVASDTNTAWDDMWLLLFKSRVVLEIGSKKYLDHPSSMFLAGQGVTGGGVAYGASGATTVFEAHRTTFANNGDPNSHCIYPFIHPRLIEPQHNFKVTLYWNSAVTLSGNQDIRIDLDGSLYRPIQ